MTVTTVPRSPSRLSGVLWTLERVTDPDSEPVSLADMKKHLRSFAGTTDEDDEIQEQFIAAREWVEDYTGRALVDQTWRLTIDNQNGLFFAPPVSGYSGDIVRGFSVLGSIREILLRRAPVIAITSFVSVDAAGVETAIDPATYALCDANSKWPRLASINGGLWISGTLKIEFRAGFLDTTGSPSTGSIPRRFIQAMKLYAEALYDRDPQMMPTLIKAAEALLKPERSELSIA